MRLPDIDVQECKARRARLAEKAADSAVIVSAHTEYVRNHDVHHPYRQDSNLFYLTGFEEPESVLIFRPGKSPESVLFVREKDVTRETWDGFRYGPQLAKQMFQMDEVYTIDQIDEKAVELLMEVDSVYYSQYRDSWFDSHFRSLMLNVKKRSGRSGKGLLPIHDAYPLIGELRLKKSAYDLELMKKACDITAKAHIEMMKQSRPGMTERELHGLFIYEVMKRGCAREGYGSIVAGGKNACTLHYVFNDEILKDGDLLLVDAGGEYKYYSADITRTWPVNGKFNDAQKRVYQKVLDLQKKMVDVVKPGLVIKDHQQMAIEGLVDIMLDEKLLKGSKEQLIENNDFRKYYPHGLGHFLGMDVHDAGAYEVSGISRFYEEGMGLTVEPGLYVPHDDESAPEELRGMGIRIEDDIVVTASGSDNLTAGAPKEISELEDIVGTSTYLRDD